MFYDVLRMFYGKFEEFYGEKGLDMLGCAWEGFMAPLCTLSFYVVDVRV